MSGYQHQRILPQGSPQSKLRHTSKSLGNAKWMSGCKVCMAGPSWHFGIIDHPKAKKDVACVSSGWLDESHVFMRGVS